MRFILPFIMVLLALPSLGKANEGAGLISSDLDGALPKALWRGQPRSEIARLLKNMPADAPLRSLQQIKHDVLLSQYEVGLIDNDIEPSDENNLLTIRLQKLIEMGRWEDSFRLYTTSTDDPQNNNALAQTGILLVLLERGLSTACLEEKVFKSRFDNAPFWQQIDDACNIELGSIMPSTAEFAGSVTLQNIYRDHNFKVSANNIERLSALSPLELALLSVKNRIDYEGVHLKREMPPHLTKTFLKDAQFPASKQADLNKIAKLQAVLPEASPPSMDNGEPKTQDEIIALVANQLRLGKRISPKEIGKLAERAIDHPENYFYLQCLMIFQPQEGKNIPQDAMTGNYLSLFSAKYEEKVNFLKSLLDKPPEFSNNPANVYEKHSSIDSDEGDAFERNRISQLKKAIKRKEAGLSLLIMLSNVENRAWAKTSVGTSKKTTFDMLKSLSEVGLIDQAHRVAKEELANLMVLYRN